MQSNKKPDGRKASAAAGGEAVAGGVLYLVATPIGNLGDVTLRALEVMSGVDVLLCEDTRRTRKLLAAHGVRADLRSCHEHNEDERIDETVAALRAGGSVALVSDAGTPGVSDPGFRLVRGVIDASLRVVAIPGASAPLAALVASGLPTDRFAFFGYAPRKDSERRRFFADLAVFSGTCLVFDSPRRVAATLRVAAEVLGTGHRCALARELTKLHEEILRGTIGEVLESLPAETRGEVTLVFAPPAAGAPMAAPGNDELRRRHRALLAAGEDPKEALRQIARATGLRRRDVYEAVVLDADDDPNGADEPVG